jgi:exopolysaccharide biosynthesis polyprenyl glycosylphosphotransferase
MGRNLTFLLFSFDLLITPLSLFLAGRLRSLLPFGKGGALSLQAVQIPMVVYLIAIVCWIGSLHLAGAYNPKRVLRWYHEVIHVAWGSFLATVLITGFLYMTYRDISRLLFVYFLMINLGLLLSYRVGLRIYYRLLGKTRPNGRSNVLILGAGDLGRRIARVLLDRSRWGFNLIGYLDDDPAKYNRTFQGGIVLGSIDKVRSVVEGFKVDEVWIALPGRAYDRMSQVVNEVDDLSVRVKIVPDYFSLALVRAKPEIMGDIPLIGLREPVIEGQARVIKRSFDLILSLLFSILALPLFGMIALAILLDSAGPVIFRHTRVGENGRLFKMLKFRTMSIEAEKHRDEVCIRTEDGTLIHKRKGDPRVTRVGRVLRRFSLDELPQLINVIKGDMSLVGPRPEMPWLVHEYEPWQRKRFAVPQGITGWWQIHDRSDKPMHMNTEEDLHYVYNYSIWLDILILIRTPVAVLRGRGAY